LNVHGEGFPAAGPNAPRGRVWVNVWKVIERTFDFPHVFALELSLSYALPIDPTIALILTFEPSVALSAVARIEPGGDFLEPSFDRWVDLSHVPDHAWLNAQFE
jgi:hypothetical protein